MKRPMVLPLCLVLLLIFPSSFGFSVPSAAKTETSEELFLRSGGAQMLKEKKYEAALSEVEKLVVLRNNDPYLLKMKGILLIRLGREAEGRGLLKKSLKLNPLDRQARLSLAESYLKEGDKGEAKTHLRFIIDNPDEIGYYEDKAQRALGVIEGEVEPRPKKEEKRWKIFGTYGYEYDDNVALQSTIRGSKVRGDRNADRFTIKNGLSYDYFRSQAARLGVSYAFSQSLHTDSLEQFNFRNHSLQHYATYFTEFLGRLLTLGFKYTFAHGTLQNTTFSSSNSFLPWLSYELTDHIMLSLYDNMSGINFRDKGFNESVSSRDGFYNTVGVMNTLFFFKRKGSLSFSYEFGYNQTEGDSFDAQIHAARTVLRSPLVEKIKGEASFSVVDDDHYNFASIPKREDVTFILGAKLIRPITKYIELRALYSFTKVKNTHAGVLGHFQYSRHIVGGEVSFSY